MKRKILNEDIWAAVRGLGMYDMSYDELEALALEHETAYDTNTNAQPFASRVIVEAAHQVMAWKRVCA